jgi:hypothetical protein
VLTVLPDNVSQDLALEGDGYVGTLLLPAGQHTFRVDAYAGERLVGTGSASATVAANMVTAVAISVIDNSGPDNAPMHFSPYLQSLVASNVTPTIGETVTLTAMVGDPDHEPITYAWTSTCGGQFDHTDAASVSWIPATVGRCTLSLQATAGGDTVIGSVDVTVFEAGHETGAVDITATINPYPILLGFSLTSGDAFRCSVDHLTTDGSCQNPAATATRYVIYSPVRPITVRDNCGGSTDELGTRWTAPASPAVCLITVTRTDGYGRSASLSMGVLVR